MGLAFALIADEDILYCSNEDAFPFFEVVIFANALNKQLSAGKWHMHKIILWPLTAEHDMRILIRVVPSEDGRCLLYCVFGDFQKGSVLGYQLLEEFEKRLTVVYSHQSICSMATTRQDILKSLCAEIVETLRKKYQDKVDAQAEEHEVFRGPPTIHYCGLSWQGLPIFSKLFDDALVEYLPETKNGEISRHELLETILSAKLATIVMNTVIRAQAHVHSIQILMDSKASQYQLINFGVLPNSYSLELFASGQPKDLDKIFFDLCGKVEADPALTLPFTGDLKPYEWLKRLLANQLFNLQNGNNQKQ
jgi:hypothetical protein